MGEEEERRGGEGRGVWRARRLVLIDIFTIQAGTTEHGTDYAPSPSTSHSPFPPFPSAGTDRFVWNAVASQFVGVLCAVYLSKETCEALPALVML